MSEEDIDKHVQRKYDVLQKLGKGVRVPAHTCSTLHPYTAPEE